MHKKFCGFAGGQPRGRGSYSDTVDYAQDSFTCKICMNSYKAKHHLYRHIENAHGKGAVPLVCNICNLVLKNKDSLSRHLRRHKAEELSCDNIRTHAA